MNKLDALPPIFFVLVYGVTCYAGVILLVWGPPSAHNLYAYYSGVSIPRLSHEESNALVALLHWPIASFLTGYAISILPQTRYAGYRCILPLNCPPFLWVLGLLSLSLGLAVFSLLRGNAVANIGAWLSYDKWISGRWRLFEILTFPEFVNFYVFLPVLTGLAAITLRGGNARIWHIVLIVLPGLAITLMLFLKKQPVVFVLVVGLSLLLKRADVGKVMFRLSLIIFLSGTLYVMLLILPSMNLDLRTDVVAIKRGDATSADIARKATQAAQDPSIDDAGAMLGTQKYERSDISPKPRRLPVWVSLLKARTPDETIRSYGKLSSASQQFLWTLNSIIFRNSAPSIFYPITFPERHGFYGVDLPFDRFSPDDNREVWKNMWPYTPGGSVMTPMQFGFFAQAGLQGACLLSLIAGTIVGVLWRVAKSRGLQSPFGALHATLVLLLVIFCATDSARNSLAASYGVLWGTALLFVLERVCLWRRVIATTASVESSL